MLLVSIAPKQLTGGPHTGWPPEGLSRYYSTGYARLPKERPRFRISCSGVAFHSRLPAEVCPHGDDDYRRVYRLRRVRTSLP